MLSLIILAWNNQPLTQRCVESLRSHTRGAHEVVLVDNGSGPDAAAYAAQAADVPVLNERNLGFAAGMNAGLAAASGDVVAFVNNDTVFPAGWDTLLLEHLDDPTVGIVAPAVTAAGNPVTVREAPGTEVERLLPFGEFPSGVVYLMRRDVARGLGGWNASYPVASAEDLDLCFTVWANGLDVVLDTRVLVEHVSQASVRHLEGRQQLYADNLDRFLSRWGDPDNSVPTLPESRPEDVAANLARARTAVRWIERMLVARRDAGEWRRRARDAERQSAVRSGRSHLRRWLPIRRGASGRRGP